ncbi:hypothetical protein FB45DRAFT_1023075 [Roridomyces roridus]|uniref:Uncharacterized protein n=1 Tax=Roridomyces roridus TaxID=1738132 RepID=A0AAD7C3L4_9AGAR|nr:hypothetical protein FB45DRAFT_1023075 [Roridomyces roridus]
MTDDDAERSSAAVLDVPVYILQPDKVKLLNVHDPLSLRLCPLRTMRIHLSGLSEELLSLCNPELANDIPIHATPSPGPSSPLSDLTELWDEATWPDTRYLAESLDRGPLDLEKSLGEISERSGTVHLEAYRPDGYTKRGYSLRLHKASLQEPSERPMLVGVQNSMNALDARCTTAGRRFRHHVPGFRGPWRPLAPGEFDLYVINLDDWLQLSSMERVDLWGMGCDLFIRHLLIFSPHVDVVERLQRMHRPDEVMEVQVPGLRRLPRPETRGIDQSSDYTKINRVTTMRAFLEHACDADGIVLNALQLPESHSTHSNPLANSGLDLQTVAYHQTNGLPGFDHEIVPSDQEFFEIAGTADTVTLSHMDAYGGTRITAQGPGDKWWPRKRMACPLECIDTVHRWDPDKPDFERGDWEGVILGPHEGTLLMQPGREHIVVGLPPDIAAPKDKQMRGTVTTGGHFFAASTVRASIAAFFHLVMKDEVLTNVEHFPLWKTFIRISAFWLDVTRSRPKDLPKLQAYLPRLSMTTTEGWTDIVYLACVAVLAPAFDRRQYIPAEIPSLENRQRDAVHNMYHGWRRWFAGVFQGTRDTENVDWEQHFFTPALVHMAVALTVYFHRMPSEYRTDKVEAGEVEEVEEVEEMEERPFPQTLDHEVEALLTEKYSADAGVAFREQLGSAEPSQSYSFFLFKGSEFCIHPSRAFS